MNLSWTSPTLPTGARGPLIPGIARVKIVASVTTAMCAMALAVSFAGFLSPLEVVLVTAYCVVGNVVFYLLLRSGRTTRWRDPACVFAHHLFMISMLLCGCALVPQDRRAALQLFMLIWAFDVPRLSRRQLTVAVLVAVTGMLVAVFATSPVGGDGPLLHGDLLALAMTILSLPAVVSISHAVREIRTRQTTQRTALADALAQLRTLSERDVLTGASNRRHAQDTLERESSRHGRTQRPFSVGLLDLDFFKQINDLHGHAVGDAVLVATVRELQTMLPAEFTVARWGGEEFLVVMPDTLSAAATDWMGQSRRSLASRDWSDCAAELRVDVSIGVCEHRQTETTEQMLGRADRALYDAKAQGRGRVVEHLD